MHSTISSGGSLSRCSCSKARASETSPRCGPMGLRRAGGEYGLSCAPEPKSSGNQSASDLHRKPSGGMALGMGDLDAGGTESGRLLHLVGRVAAVAASSNCRLARRDRGPYTAISSPNRFSSVGWPHNRYDRPACVAPDRRGGKRLLYRCGRDTKGPFLRGPLRAWAWAIWPAASP